MYVFVTYMWYLSNCEVFCQFLKVLWVYMAFYLEILREFYFHIHWRFIGIFLFAPIYEMHQLLYIFLLLFINWLKFNTYNLTSYYWPSPL